MGRGRYKTSQSKFKIKKIFKKLFIYKNKHKNWNKYGIRFQHISQNPIRFTNNNWKELYLGDINWDDYSYGFILKQKYKKVLFNLNIDWVNSKNYAWKNNQKATNLYFLLNTIYLW